MSRLIRNRTIVDDRYTLLREAASLADVPDGVPVIVPLALWMERRAALIARGEAGVWLAPGDDPTAFPGFVSVRNAPLSEVKSLLAGAQLFIGNDSGPAHIAAAFGVPVVVLFGPSDPVNWAPWRTEAQVLTNPGAIARISVEQVIAAAEALKVRA